MSNLIYYEDFLSHVNALGFMTFSNVLPGFPSLTAHTDPLSWHTGDPQTDPWQWKDRAAEEKKLAFGCVLGGNKGFIAPKMYSLFHTAFHPTQHMEEMHAYGLVQPDTWRLSQLFEENTSLTTGEIRRAMQVTKKHGASKVDRAIQELERQFIITVAGSRRKIDKFGQPYGWASNIYQRVEDWAPKEWFEMNSTIPKEEARQRILDQGIAISSQVNQMELVKMLGMKMDETGTA